jgi:hypothetical protein
MLTRGKMVGEIIDSLSQLRLSIIPRNKVGLFELNNYCEDFFKEILNIIEDINLRNLNLDESNYPGIDLGDEKAKVAYQVTTDKSSLKVNSTLSKIKPKDKIIYNEIYIFIIGEKQKQYTLDSDVNRGIDFDKNKNIIDLNYIYKRAIHLSFDHLDKLYNLIKKNVMRVQAELEIPNDNGSYENSIYNHLEKRSFSKPKNADKLYDFLEYGFPEKGEYWPRIKTYNKSEFHKSILSLYSKLKNLPRVTREFYSILLNESNINGRDYRINYAKVKRIINLSNDIINEELDLLHEEKLIYFDDFYSHTSYIEFDSIFGQEYFYYYFDNYLSENNITLDEVFVDLDFTVFEK